MTKHYTNTGNPIDFPKIPKSTEADMARLASEARKQKKKAYPEIDPLDRKEIKSSLGYSRVGRWGK